MSTKRQHALTGYTLSFKIICSEIHDTKNVASVSGVLRFHRLPPAPLLVCRSALALVVNCADHIVFSDSLTDVHSRISYTRAMSD